MEIMLYYVVLPKLFCVFFSPTLLKLGVRSLANARVELDSFKRGK